MAFLCDDDELTRESWLAWAYELMRRGLRPVGEIEIHGPHQPPGDFIWGTAECDFISGGGLEVSIRTLRPSRSIWHIAGVRVQAAEDPEDRYPVLAPSALPATWKQEMAEVKANRLHLKQDAIRSRNQWKAMNAESRVIRDHGTEERYEKKRR